MLGFISPKLSLLYWEILFAKLAEFKEFMLENVRFLKCTVHCFMIDFYDSYFTSFRRC